MIHFRVLAAALIAKIADWHLKTKSKRELPAISTTGDADKVSLGDSTNLLQKMAKKQTKLVAAVYAKNPYLPRDDLSESENVMLERVESRKKSKPLASIPEGKITMRGYDNNDDDEDDVDDEQM